MKRILVTGSNLFFSARLIHDLGKRGVRITAADSSWCSAGKLSRMTSRRLTVPSLKQNPAGYLESIVRELNREPYDLLLPTFEESLLLAEHRDNLNRLTRVFLPPFQTMYRLHCKPLLNEFCIEHNIPSPPTRRVTSRQQLGSIADEIGYPLVLKLPTANNSVGRMFCQNQSELEQQFDRLVTLHGTDEAQLPFLQKKIVGELICTLCYCSNGRKIAEVIYRSNRMFPEAGGTTVHRQSIRHSQIEAITDHIAETSNWSGFIGFDFMVEASTGTPYLIDANVRANPAIQLGFLSGIDWSQIIIDQLEGREPAIQSSREGLNAHNLILDVSWLVEGILPRAGGILRMPRRIQRFLKPEWHVHSRGDLLGLGEYGSVVALALNALTAGVKSVMTGRQPGELLLEHSSYDPSTAQMLRQINAKLENGWFIHQASKPGINGGKPTIRSKATARIR